MKKMSTVDNRDMLNLINDNQKRMSNLSDVGKMKNRFGKTKININIANIQQNHVKNNQILRIGTQSPESNLESVRKAYSINWNNNMGTYNNVINYKSK